MKNSIFNAVCKTRYLALLVVLILTCGNAWGESVTLGPSDTWTGGKSGGGAAMSITKSGISVSMTSGYNTGTQVRYYSGASMTISSSVGNITQIQFTYTNSNITSASPGTWNQSNKKWTGNAASITFGNGGQVRITNIEVTYTAAASCGVPTSPTNGTKTATTQPVSWTAPSSAPANGYVVAVCATNTTPNTNVTITNGNAYWSGDYYYAHIAAGTRNYTFSTTSGAYLTAGTTYYWWVRSKCGASDYSAWVAGTAFTIPNIEVSETAIDGLDYDVSAGGPSTAKTFTVSGTGLTGNLTVALDEGASSKFEISKTSASSGYGNSLTLTQYSGTVSSTTIWVRLKSGHSAGDYLEQITVSGGTATSKTVAIEGVVCAKLSAPTGLTLSTDHGGTAGRTRFGWNSVSGASGYKVTVTKGGVSNSVTTASDRYYYITTFPDGDYTWTVQALGDGSTYCEEGTAADGTPFSYCHKDVSGVTPTVNATTSITKIGATANWAAVSDADHYTVKVYQGTTVAGDPVKTYDNVTSTSQAITGLTANTDYIITVQAHDACGHNSVVGSGGQFKTQNLTLYTVTFHNAAGSAPGAVIQTTEDGTVSIPNATACEGWTFVGWKVGSAQSSTTTDPTSSGTWITSASWPKTDYVPSGNINAYAVFSKTEGGSTPVTDEMTLTDLGVSGTSYTDFSDISLTSDAVYAGQCAGGSSSIQLRTKNSNSGVIMTSSGGNVTNVTVTFNASTTTGKGIQVYGKNSAYSSATDLFNSSTYGTLLGTIIKGTNTSLSINEDYAFIGFRSDDGAAYLDKVDITIGGGGTTTWTSTPDCSKPIYLDATYFGESDKFAVYSWEAANSSTNNQMSEAYMTPVSDCRENIYTANIPLDHDRVIFLHCSSGATPAWSNKDKQTVDLTPGANDFFTVSSGSGDSYNGSWGTYTQQVTVTYNINTSANGVSASPSSECVVKGTGHATQPTVATHNLGYSLAGWYENAEGTGSAWNFATGTFSDDKTLYAKWTAEPTTKIYLKTTFSNQDWQTGSVIVFAHFYVDGTSQAQDVLMTRNACDPSILEADAPYGSTHVSFARCQSGTASLGANWDTDGNIYNYVAGLTMPSNLYFSITGWGSGKVSTGQAEGSAYVAPTYTISYDKGTGSGSAMASTTGIACGADQTISSNTYTPPSEMSFAGWYADVDVQVGGVTKTAGVDLIPNGATIQNVTGNITLTAQWVACTLYTVTLRVNNDTYKELTQASCGAAINLSGITPPACDAKYSFVGWSTTNPGLTTSPSITTSYTPEANTTLYAVYSYSATTGTLVKSTTGFGGAYKSYFIVASSYNSAMGEVTTGTVDGVPVSKSGDICIPTGDAPDQFYFEDAGSSKWFVYQPYIDSEENYGYIYFKAPTGSGGKFSWYDDTDYTEWYIYDDNIKPYGYYDYDYIETYMKTNATDALWTLSINASGVATLTATDAGSNTRSWQYNNSADKFSTYTSSQKAIALYEASDGTAYTTQPTMTVYTITKGVETNGTFNISAGVVCSGNSVSVSATPNPGYVFSGWTISSGSGSFSPNASTASGTFTPTANSTITANFVAATPHDITWMVNGTAYTTGEPTNSMAAGTSFSTMTLPTAPANNTLSSACDAVANQFVGWSQTDMGFATGQSAPAKLFTNAAGAGTAYGLMGDADVTFYAVFAQDGSSNYMSRCPNTYTITLDDNGSYGGDGSATATEMSTTLTNIVAPTRLGYSVEGYYKEVGTTTKVATYAGALQNGSGSGIADWTNSSSQFIGTSDGTLYTNWNIDTYNITYDNLNGASNSNPATYQVTTATIVLADPGSRTGYTFTGWTYGGNPITQIILGSTGDKTITANWNAEQYTITYKDQGDNAYSGDKTDGRPTGNPATHTYGSATDLVNGTRTGYRFDGWFTAPACTGDPITSLGATDYTSAITLYAKWTASHTYSFSKNGVIDGTLQLGAVEGETVTMPNTTVNCGLWTTFEGWVESDVAETTTEPTMYKAGDVYVVPVGSGDKTFKAVYSKHEGDGTVSYEKVTSGHKSGTYIMVSSNDLVYTGQHSGSGTTDYGDNTSVIQSAGVVTAANLPNTAKEVTVRIGKGGSINNTFAIQIPSAKYLSATNGNYLNSDITDVKSAYVWKFDNGTDSYGKSGSEKTGSAGAIRSTTQTTRVIQPNGARFACYENTYTNYVYLYRKKVAGTTYYTTAPASCAVPTQITVSYNDNKSHAGDQTITGMPSGTTLTFTDYPDFASYTIGSAPDDPTGYHFAGWNTSADGNGDDYTAGGSVTTFGYVENITLWAKWERVYTVTLYDNGVKRTELVQASEGAAVDLPSGNNCGDGSAFTFEGWTESAVQLNADPARPATLHAAGSYVPTSDITLYSVYSKSVAGCEDFAEGVSGAYKMYYDGSKYATTAGTSGSYTGATSGTAEVFYIAYAPAHTGYTIRTSTGFVGWNYNGEELTKGNATPYYWKISGSSSNWVITPEPSAYTKQFKSTDGSKFQLYAAGTTGKLLLQKSAMTYYYNTAICEESKITFHDGGGTISGTPTTPTGASWNSSTHVLSGLEDCDKITEFPTANYDGWTFIGWSTEDYSNSGKHTADHPKENASTDEPDGSEIYKTGGNSYVVRGGSVDLYPVFTRFPENEPFNTETGGDYYIYYLKPGTDDGYGANIRVYAGEYDGEKRYSQTTSCAAATTFTFTKSGDVWHIQNKANSKYIGGKLNEDWLVENASLGTLTDWTIAIKSGNQFYASCQGGGRYITFSTSANYFMDYSTTANPGICLPVYLGSCTERIYSSEPNPTPTIDLTGEPMVTSSVGERVRATATMTLNASHLSSVPATRIKISGPNLYFATSATENPTTPSSPALYVDLTGGSVSQTIYVYYTPTATDDGIENIVVTAQAYNTNTPTDIKTTGVVHARHLPADFVIAAKWGDKWYALPNTCAGEGSNTAGVQIEVDNNDIPTAATAAPSTAKWGMRQTKKGSRSDGSYNDRLVFTERTTSTANDQKTLYNYNQAEVFTYATYTDYNNTNPERYEWIPVTTDFGDYELTNANNADHHLILRNSDGLFVAQNSDKSYDGKVRLLPATFYEEAPVQIVEWKENSVVVMYTGTETSATTKVGTNSASASQALSTHKLTHGIYELTTGQSLASNDGKTLLLTFGSMKKAFEIPVIVTGNSTAYSGHEKQDVVIVNGGKLSAAATKYSYRNIYVYGGGKLKIASGTDLGVNNIILRAGGISTSGIGSSPSATYEYVYPQVELRGTLSSTKTNIKYEYITDYDHWYHLVLPFDGTLSSITYPTEYYGDNVAGNKGSWIIKRYAGEVRATGNYDAWVDIETESATSVTAGHGYIYWGAPKKVTIGGSKQRQAWGIQRITMPITAAAAMTAENADKTITGLSSYSEVAGNSGKVNDQGWNLIGNPYLTNLTGLNSESLITGKLVEELDPVTEKWTGRWVNNDDGVRYVTIPSEHFDTYEAQTMASFTIDNPMKTGCVFFVQIEDDATGVTFATAKRASLMPALLAKTEQKIDVETGIVLSDESKHDEVNFWIKDGKTEAYEYNADYPKTMNTTNFNIYGVHSNGELSWVAISPEIAESSMAIGYQVPVAGDYMLSLSETYVSDEIEHVFVTDHGVSPEVTTDLMEEDYNFYVNQAETNDVRFTVAFKLKVEDPGTTTNVENTAGVDSDKPLKFIYNDKMYILRNGIIYDAVGKKVSEINK